MIFSLALGLMASCSAIVFPARAEIQRTARDMRDLKMDGQGLDLLSAGLKTTGQKWSPEEYHTLSSLQQQQTSSDVGHSAPVTAKVDLIYPALTTDSPSLLTRGRYVNNHLHPPYLHHLFGNANNQQETEDPEELSEYSANSVTAPKWNRYFPNHRQLKKYGPVIMETDVSADSSNVAGSGYNVYDNGGGVDYGANYEPENYKNPNVGSDGFVGWYGSDQPTQFSQPAAAVVAEVRKPNNKMTVDVHKLTLLAIAKIGLAKLKVLTVIKFLAFLWVKLKMLLLLKGFVFAKFAVMSKLIRLFVLPFMPDLLTWLRNAAMMQLNPAMGMNMSGTPAVMADIPSHVVQLSRNDSVADPALRRSTAGPGAIGNLFQFVSFVQSAKCADRTACRVAGTRPLSVQSALSNWILSPLVSYIPNRKLKSYMSTLKEVSDYRLENIFSHPSTEEWIKWCDERYYCDEDEDENDADDNSI